MNWTMLSVMYLCALQDKGYGDQPYWEEYNFICHEINKTGNSKSQTQSNSLQTEILLPGKELVN